MIKRKQMVRRHSLGGICNIMHYTIRYCRQYNLWDILFFLSSAMILLFWLLVCILAQQLAVEFCYPYDISFTLQSLTIAIWISILLYLGAIYLPRIGRIPKVIGNGIVLVMFLSTLLIFLGVIVLTNEFVSTSTAYFSETDSETILIGRIISSYRLVGAGDEFPLYLTNLDLWEFGILMDNHLLCLVAYRYGSWLIVLLSILAVVWTISAVLIYLKLYCRWFEWVFLTSFFPAAYQIITPVLYSTGLLSNSFRSMDPFYSCDVISICFFLTIPLAAMLVITKQNHDAI